MTDNFVCHSDNGVMLKEKNTDVQFYFDVTVHTKQTKTTMVKIQTKQTTLVNKLTKQHRWQIGKKTLMKNRHINSS